MLGRERYIVSLAQILKRKFLSSNKGGDFEN